MFIPLINLIKKSDTLYGALFSAKNYCYNLIHQIHYNSSISDDGSYPDFCEKASNDDTTFATFKSNKIYTRVLEHTSYELGLEYIKIIKERTPQLLNSITDFKKNDLYGAPATFYYSEIDTSISPTTLRYIKVLSDLIRLYSFPPSLNVCEIGVGYGGQCRINMSYLGIKKYTLVDLPQVLKLCQKFLSNFETSNNTYFQTMDELDVFESYDLVISNYAFSELKKDIQEIYLEKIILKSKSGYITYNTLSHTILDGYSTEDLANIIPGSKIIPEEPLTADGNCIVVWGFM
ncbi:MAG: putative sugar O-methyltransferase [Methanocorpusculum sp.]|uniref:putative sugar O-methyltransferase n=1 Tax=Methanocorpusculum sp. TaxID=2058474 RepID=UPI002B21B239|nr:putative sugar O-methyltransferase [Methanocorpusculum sp.]MEA5086233.1 putative sugar O-methyltransferase [Methanocorpusculum sp.]